MTTKQRNTTRGVVIFEVCGLRYRLTTSTGSMSRWQGRMLGHWQKINAFEARIALKMNALEKLYCTHPGCSCSCRHTQQCPDCGSGEKEI